VHGTLSRKSQPASLQCQHMRTFCTLPAHAPTRTPSHLHPVPGRLTGSMGSAVLSDPQGGAAGR